MNVDLFLNGPLGVWVLDQVDAGQVGCVHSPMWEICQRARALGIAAVEGNANDVTYHAASVGLSMHYPYILKEHVLERYQALYNVHPALLPWGKCYYPVFWALWAGEPAGCTLHRIAAGIDDGQIVAQRAVPAYPWDTGGTLHRRVSEAEQGLFLEYWPMIAAGEALASRPQPESGSFHYRSEFLRLKNEAAVEALSGTELLDLIRCLSHPDYSGLVVTLGGRTYEVSARPLT